MRYRFQGLYELDSLAVVNVRDTGPVKNAFKILMFPESHMYQTDTAKAKVSFPCAVLVSNLAVSGREARMMVLKR